jgi:DNA-directed RNA polymerase subunit RPC12/RpoP
MIMSVLNFECKTCHQHFDADVGAVMFNENEERPTFESEISCKKCGKRTLDDIYLTEIGQTQLTQIFLTQ